MNLVFDRIVRAAAIDDQDGDRFHHFDDARPIIVGFQGVMQLDPCLHLKHAGAFERVLDFDARILAGSESFDL